MSFHFLRLPQVVLSIIVNLAEPNQLICLTQCSKRAYNLVKTYRKKSENVKILVDDALNNVRVYYDDKINCCLSLDSGDREWELVEKDYPTKNLFGADFRLSLYCEEEEEEEEEEENEDKDKRKWELKWDDPTKDGILTLIDWVTDLFRTDVWCLCIRKETFHRWKWVESRQGQIDDLEVWAVDSTEDEIQGLFQSKSKKLTLLTIPSWFQYPGVLPSRTSLGSWQGYWFTPNHLMTSDFIELCIHKSTLTNSDVNQFLRHWLAGGSPRLKTLILQIKGVNLNEIIHGIEGVIPNENPRNQKYWTISGEELTFKDRLYLRRNDGVIATCSTIENRFLRRNLVLAVWPDAKNNACLINNFQ